MGYTKPLLLFYNNDNNNNLIHNNPSDVENKKRNKIKRENTQYKIMVINKITINNRNNNK